MPAIDLAIAQPLADIARDARAFLVPLWKQKHGRFKDVLPTPAAGRCIESSVFFLTLLNEEYGIEGQYRYGRGRQREGFRHGSVWKNHAWVETGPVITDLTPDQFDEPPIVVTPVQDPRYRDNPKHSLPDEVIMATAENWWAKWQIARMEGKLPPPRKLPSLARLPLS